MSRAVPSSLLWLSLEKGEYRLHKKTSEWIRENVRAPFHAVSMCGPYRSGKSLLLSTAEEVLKSPRAPAGVPAGAPAAAAAAPGVQGVLVAVSSAPESSTTFRVSDSSESCTKGIYISTSPVMY